MEEVERRKATFIRTESNDAARLSEKLHKMFTTILIRRVKYELAERKRVMEDKLTEMAANHEKRLTH